MEEMFRKCDRCNIKILLFFFRSKERGEIKSDCDHWRYFWRHRTKLSKGNDCTRLQIYCYCDDFFLENCCFPPHDQNNCTTRWSAFLFSSLYDSSLRIIVPFHNFFLPRFSLRSCNSCGARSKMERYWYLKFVERRSVMNENCWRCE